MAAKKPKASAVEPQRCPDPDCGAEAAVCNPKPRLWYVKCSRNSELSFGGHRIQGHTMHTKTAAIAEWNKLTPGDIAWTKKGK